MVIVCCFIDYSKFCQLNAIFIRLIIVLHYNHNKKSMNQEANQYIITLARLYLPSHIKMDKLLLSVTVNQQENFIQNQKNIKNQKVNFYRENLFIESISHEISFNIYQISPENQRQLIKSLKISKQELSSVERRPAMFNTKNEGFELVWQCGIFQENESQSYIQTDREYSQFNGDCYFSQEESDIKLSSFNTQVDLEHKGSDICNKKQNTTASTFYASNQIQSCQSLIFKNGESLSPKSKQASSSKASLNLVGSLHRINVKSDIYQNFMNNLTSIIYNGKK